MPESLPTRWLEGPCDRFAGEAMRNEYYVFQVGVFAARRALTGVTVTFSDLRSERGVIPAGSLTCFNTGGVDCYGKPFKKDVRVAKGAVQALWMGVDIPLDAKAGTHSIVGTFGFTHHIVLTAGRGRASHAPMC